MEDLTYTYLDLQGLTTLVEKIKSLDKAQEDALNEMGKTLSGLFESAFTGTEYDDGNKEIVFKNGEKVLAKLDAKPFIKDGMVESAVVEDSDLVITLNSDANNKVIRIPIADIFNPENYYDKDGIDGIKEEIQTSITELTEKINNIDPITEEEIKDAFVSYLDLCVSKEKAQVGNVVIYDTKKEEKLFVSIDNLKINKFPIERFIPIGLVAVPVSEDNVENYGFEEGEGAMMSLALMNANTPEIGMDTNEGSCAFSLTSYVDDLVEYNVQDEMKENDGLFNTNFLASKLNFNINDSFDYSEMIGAIYACKKYYTPGTIQLEWYWPSKNELVEITNQYRTIISEIINRLREIYIPLNIKEKGVNINYPIIELNSGSGYSQIIASSSFYRYSFMYNSWSKGLLNGEQVYAYHRF